MLNIHILYILYTGVSQNPPKINSPRINAMLSELLRLHPLYIRNNIINNNSYNTNNNKYDDINSSIHDDDSNNNEYTMINKKYTSNNNIKTYIKLSIKSLKRFLAKIPAKIRRIWIRLLSYVRI